LLKDVEDSISIDGGCPQIVPTEVYENVQKRITEHKHTGGRLNAKQNYLLSGKVFCKECGRSMVGNTPYSGRDKTLYITYRCPSKRYCCSNKEINRDYLEKYVIELLEEKILNASSLLYIAKQIESLSSVPPQPDYEAEAKLAEVNTALKNVADAVAQGLLSEALITRLRELEQQKAELEAVLQKTDAPSGNVNIDTNLILSNYREVKDSPASPAYKEFICGFISKIDVGRYTVDITLKTGLDICKALDTTYPVRRQEMYERKKTV
jgi:site-specific DNA recombinase